jgi:hypothetical protein
MFGSRLNNKVKNNLEPPENEGKGSRGGPEEVDDDRSWEAFSSSYFLFHFILFSIFDFFENIRKTQHTPCSAGHRRLVRLYRAAAGVCVGLFRFLYLFYFFSTNFISRAHTERLRFRERIFSLFLCLEENRRRKE